MSPDNDSIAEYQRNIGELRGLVNSIQSARERAHELLWQAQLVAFPDSNYVTRQEALRWLDEMPPFDRFAEQFEASYASLYREAADRLDARYRYVEKRVLEYRARISRCMALTLQYPVGVFYECGRRPDTTYAWRGFRYGVEGSNYISGFGRD